MKKGVTSESESAVILVRTEVNASRRKTPIEMINTHENNMRTKKRKKWEPAPRANSFMENFGTSWFNIVRIPPARKT
jgi:hypothetical protein